MAIKLRVWECLTSKAFISIACALCAFGTVNAQSFDCKKAQSYAEKAICNNPTLSSMDIQLNDIFVLARNKANNSDVFKTIARGNLSLRNQCKNETCLQKWFENSISLYEYLLSIIPTDSLAEYPPEVQKICKDNVATVDMLNCAGAQIDYQQSVLHSQIQKILKLAANEKQKKIVQDFYDQWKKDREKYCSLEFSGGTADSLNISGCMLTWTEDLVHKTEDAEEFFNGLTSSDITNENVAAGSM